MGTILSRLWGATIYLPSGLYCRNFRLRLRPADYCCSCWCACCDCCDLRKSVCIAAGWQFLAGGVSASLYTVLTIILLKGEDQISVEQSTLFLSLMIYLLVYWWLYFLCGILGCCAVADTQGILTYESRVIGMCRAYLALTVLCTVGHLNLVGLDRSLWNDPLSRTNIFLTFLPLLWDWYIVYLAWSLLRKLQEQRKGLFRGKPVMSNQRKPEQVAELHSAHRLALTPPPGQLILPLAHLRPPPPAAAAPAAAALGPRLPSLAPFQRTGTGRRPSREISVSGGGGGGRGLAQYGSFAEWAVSEVDASRATPGSGGGPDKRAAHAAPPRPSETGSCLWDVRDSSAGGTDSSSGGSYASAAELPEGRDPGDGGVPSGATDRVARAGGRVRDPAEEPVMMVMPPPLSVPLPPAAAPPPPPPPHSSAPSFDSSASGGGAGGSAAWEYGSVVASAVNDGLTAIEEEDLPAVQRLRAPQRTVTSSSLQLQWDGDPPRHAPSPPRQRPQRPPPPWHFLFPHSHQHQQPADPDHTSNPSSRNLNLNVASAGPSASLLSVPYAAADGRPSLPGADRLTGTTVRGGSGGGEARSVFEIRMQPFGSVQTVHVSSAPGSRDETAASVGGGRGGLPRSAAYQLPLPPMEPSAQAVPATAMYGAPIFAPTPRGAPTTRAPQPWLAASGAGAAGGGGGGRLEQPGVGPPQMMPLPRAPSLSRKAAFLRQVSLQRARAYQPQTAGPGVAFDLGALQPHQQSHATSFPDQASQPPSPRAHRAGSPLGAGARPFAAPWDAAGAGPASAAGPAARTTNDGRKTWHNAARPALGPSPPPSPSVGDISAAAATAHGVFRPSSHAPRAPTRVPNPERHLGGRSGAAGGGPAGGGAPGGAQLWGHQRARQLPAHSDAPPSRSSAPSSPPQALRRATLHQPQHGKDQHRHHLLQQGGGSFRYQQLFDGGSEGTGGGGGGGAGGGGGSGGLPRAMSSSSHSQSQPQLGPQARSGEPRPLPAPPLADFAPSQLPLARSFTPPRSPARAGEGKDAMGFVPLPPMPRQQPAAGPAGGHQARSTLLLQHPPCGPAGPPAVSLSAAGGRPPVGPPVLALQSRLAQRGTRTSLADWWAGGADGGGGGGGGGGGTRAPQSDDWQVPERRQGMGPGVAGGSGTQQGHGGGGGAGGFRVRPQPAAVRAPATATAGSSAVASNAGSPTAAAAAAATSPAGGRAAAFASMLRPLQLPSLATAAVEGAQAMYDKFYVPLTTRGGRGGGGGGVGGAGAAHDAAGAKRMRSGPPSDPGDGGGGGGSFDGRISGAGWQRGGGAHPNASYVSLEITPAELGEA